MKIVIDIPEESYKATCDGCMLPPDVESVVQGIKQGTPLPKGHGDLIDRKDLIENGISKGFCDWYDEIKCANTIIEADKVESEDKE